MSFMRDGQGYIDDVITLLASQSDFSSSYRTFPLMGLAQPTKLQLEIEEAGISLEKPPSM